MADTEVDKVADIEVYMVADMVADINIDINIDTVTRLAQTFSTQSLPSPKIFKLSLPNAYASSKLFRTCSSPDLQA